MPPQQDPEYHWECESQIDPAFQAQEEAWAHQKCLEQKQNAPPTDETTAQPYWQAQYDFFYQYLRGEVDRLRFNDRADPIEIDLYPAGGGFMGRVQVAQRYLIAVAAPSHDRQGAHILKIRITFEN